MRLLYYAPYSRGGMADYGHHQAGALARLGAEVTLLCPANDEGPWHRDKSSPPPYELRPILRGWRVRTLLGPWRRVLFAGDLLLDARTLAGLIGRERFPCVLFGAYNEYFAPWWAGSLRKLARERGTVFGAVVHDPLRTGGVGPTWWRRRSVAAAYSMLREAFVHSPLTLDTVRPMPTLRTTVIPHGPYPVPAPRAARADCRAKYGLPPHVRVLLSFGYIRDDKNLELAVRALPRFPDVYLLVAGTEQSSAQKPAEFYRRLATELGVADRCRWLVRFIPAEEIGDIFQASDLLLLTYSRVFCSASGVLNMASGSRLPALASGGDGNLRYVVRRYNLGAWIEPDDLDALIAGIDGWLHGALPIPRWEDYTNENSWRRNAEIVAEKMDGPGPRAA